MRIYKQNITFLKTRILAGLVVIASLAGTVSAEQGGAVPTPPMELLAHEAWMATSYMPKRIPQAAEIQPTIAQQINDAFPPGETGTSARYDNFRGADIGANLQTTLMEMLSSMTLDFWAANPLLPSPIIMAMPPKQMFIPQNRTLLPGCELRSQMRYFDWGTCITGVVPVIGFCNVAGPVGLIWLTSSMVEYRWPAYKVDMSEQPFASFYYLKPLIEAAVLPINKIILEQLGPINIEMGFTMLQRRREIEEQIESALFQQTPAATAAPYKVNQNFFQELNQVDEDYRHNVPAGMGTSRGYGRVVPEMANIMTLLPQPKSSQNMWRFVPHVAKLAMVGADLPTSIYGWKGDALQPMPIPLGGFPFSRFFFASALWRDRFAAVVMPFGQWRCMMNNKHDKKTPLDVLLGLPNTMGTPPNFNDPNVQRAAMLSLFPPPMDDDMRLCIDQVGEQMAMYDHTRPNSTDKTFQSLWRASFYWRTFADIMARQYQGGKEDPNNPAESEPPDNEKDANALGFNWMAFLTSVMDFLGGQGPPPAYHGDTQGAWKAWRHLFRRSGNGADLYRFFQRRGEFMAETPQMVPLDDIVKPNWAYDKGGIKEFGSNFNQSAEVWPVFKGCYGKDLGGFGEPLKGEYPLFALPGVSPLGLGPMPNFYEDVMKLY